MHSCQPCGKSFSRKDSLLRHQRQYCNAILPRQRSLKRIASKEKVDKTNNLSEYSSLDFIHILSSMLNEQRHRWKKDFKKLKDALLPPENSDSSDNEEPDYADDDHYSNEPQSSSV
jgi:hypothetical protein